MTVKELHEFLTQLIEQGKGDYEMFCEGGYCPLGITENSVWDERKEIIL